MKSNSIKKKKKKNANRNFVAKHAREFNRAVTMIDRKKESKKNGSYYG